MNAYEKTKEIIEASLSDLVVDCKKTISIDKNGQFNLTLADSEKRIAAWYGWDNTKQIFSPSSVINVMLSDTRNRKTYVTYITEVSLDELSYVMSQITAIANKYFCNDFEVVDDKREYLRFDAQELAYSEFVLAKEYQDLH